MDAPAVQYVRTSDGYDIAYAVSGEGTPLVFMPSNFQHVQLAWRYPALSEWLPALAARFKLVQFDTRGAGMSTRGLPDEMDHGFLARDLETVIDKLGLDSMVLLGGPPLIYEALHYVLRHPQKVLAVVAACGPLPKASAQWGPLLEQDWDIFLHSVVPRDRTPDEAREIVDMLKQAFDQHDFAIIARRPAAGHTESLLAKLRIPILILHPRDHALLDESQARWAAQVSGGRLVLIDGDTVFGDVNQGMRAIEAFLADVLPAAKPHLGMTHLSNREQEVLRLLAAGRSNPEIAKALVISSSTVAKHVSSILDKTGTANRAQAAVYARDHGLA
jgi:DNA-binding CsgD family transcriptional regulator/pimeloyl-ACP methyl ester carboxylesterase